MFPDHRRDDITQGYFKMKKKKISQPKQKYKFLKRFSIKHFMWIIFCVVWWIFEICRRDPTSFWTCNSQYMTQKSLAFKRHKSLFGSSLAHSAAAAAKSERGSWYKRFYNTPKSLKLKRYKIKCLNLFSIFNEFDGSCKLCFDISLASPLACSLLLCLKYHQYTYLSHRRLRHSQSLWRKKWQQLI